MKKVLFVLAVLALAGIGTGTADAATPGSNYYVSELNVNELLQRKFDQAFCSGIQRFGKHGSFPYEKYVVFDCTTTLNDKMCSSVRVRAVNASRPGYYTLRVIRPGHCF